MAHYRILFVDDDPEIVEVYRDALEAEGYEVLACGNDTEARTVIRKESFDLAVIDLQLSPSRDNTSGFDVAKLIPRDIPVIIFSQHLTEDAIYRAMNLKNEDAKRDAHVIRKSEGPDALVERIRKVLPHRVFVAHGHDLDFKDYVVLLLDKLGIRPIVLGDTEGGGDTFAEAIEKHSNVSCAVILLTPDDLGEAKAEKKKLQPRARQNVILEWGYFVGVLHRDKVIALVKNEKEIELPSNYAGLRYIPVEADGKWRKQLGKDLVKAGVPVDLERLP